MQLLRISLMIACIFAAGIATGRYTMPAVRLDVPAQFSSTSGRVITPRLVVQFFDQKFRLNPKQQQAVLAAAQTFVSEIAKTESATKERFDIFRRYYPRVRAVLRADQLAAFDAMVQMHEARMASILKEQGKEP